MTIAEMFPALDMATEAALRFSIERFGVLVPVVKDQHGRVLDGRHRVRLADSLGVEYETRIREVADEDEAREIARTLNEDRRQLSRDQRREVAVALRQEGHSARAIGRALKIAHTTVLDDVAASGGVETPPERTSAIARVSGLDGKRYPAARSVPAPASKRNGFRKDKDTPFAITAKRHREVAEATKGRLIDGLSEVCGICRGIADLDLGMVAAVSDAAELKTWASKASNAARELNRLRSRLMEVSANE